MEIHLGAYLKVHQYGLFIFIELLLTKKSNLCPYILEICCLFDDGDEIK